MRAAPKNLAASASGSWPNSVRWRCPFKLMSVMAMHSRPRRQTPLPVWPDPLSDALANDATKQTQWAAFIRRNGLAGQPKDFANLVVTVREYLAPVLRG